MARLSVLVAAERGLFDSLQGLQTPFTWISPVMTVRSCHDTDDKLCLLGTPWSVLLNRLHSAYSYLCNDRFEDGRSRLVGCFMQLLPALADGCDIIANHREALRHVLDATWAAMAQMEAMRGGLQTSNPDWKTFTGAITPFEQLDRRQRAAVCAIQGTLAMDPQGLREAIKLNPNEGEWHYKLGYILAENRGSTPPTSEEITTLRKGYQLRPNVDSMVRLARSLANTGRKGLEEAVALLEEMLVLYPTHPRALFQAGCFLSTLRKQLGKPDADGHASSVELLERCLAAVDGKCAYVLFKLGSMHIYEDRSATSVKGTEYIDRALAVDPVAVDAFQKEMVDYAANAKREKDIKEARARRKARKC